jgi:hypothetical protein
LSRNDLWCSLYLTENCLPVCPTYALWQSEHVNLYTPDFENLSVVWFYWPIRWPKVLVVQNVMFMSAFLKMLVMYSVSFPAYVKVVQLCFSVEGSCFRLLWVQGLLCSMGNESLCWILWIVFNSCW